MEHLIRWLPQRLLDGPFVDALDWALAVVITLAAATLLVMAIAFIVRGFADVARRVRLAIVPEKGQSLSGISIRRGRS